jgi:hypothetical protein
MKSTSFGGAFLVADVDLARRIFANYYNSESGLDTVLGQ